MKNISTRIAVSIFLCSAIALTIVTGVLSTSLLKHMRASANEEVEGLASNYAGNINSYITQAQMKVNSIADVMSIEFELGNYNDNTEEYFHEYLYPKTGSFVKKILEDTEFISASYFTISPDFGKLTDHAHEIYYLVGENGIEEPEPTEIEEYEDKDNPDMTWYFEPLRLNSGYWSMPSYDEGWMVSYTVPVKINDQNIGVAGVDITLDNVSEIVQAIKIYDTGFALLMDNFNGFFDNGDILEGFSDELKNEIIEKTNSGNGIIQMQVNGKDMLIGFASLENDYILYTFAPVDEVLKSTYTLLTLVIIIAIIALIFSVFFAISVGRGISRPIKKVSYHLNQIADGDYSFVIDNTLLNNKDETGQLSVSMSKVKDRLLYISTKLEEISKGDLTVDINLAFDGDTIGGAIRTILNNFNRVLKEIYVSASEVSTSSKQIANGTFVLAQSSTEKASAILNLSDITHKTGAQIKENSVLSEKASELEEKMSDLANTGSNQMENMIKAVEEIDKASKDISKVMQVINDIAFQTNILALNASVEAARAGIHGKGFAVVAEEVRNLAIKSADAANQTEKMLISSMEKASEGSRTAEEISESLQKILEGINENSTIISSIASSGREQANDISKIDFNIKELSDQDHLMAAATEESAAAAEQMSQQALSMLELISHFKLVE